MPPLLSRLLRHRRTLTLPLLTTAATIFINDHILEIMSIRGSSMAPTLSAEYHTTGRRDYVLFRKWAPTRDLKHGDVVALYAPHAGPAPRLVVKRVVGMDGDTVTLDRRRIKDGEDEAGRMGRMVEVGADGAVGVLGPARVTVPQGHVWVEGDNWRDSRDSNHYGPVSRSLIAGRAVRVVWPWEGFWGKPWEEKAGRKAKGRVVRTVPGEGGWG